MKAAIIKTENSKWTIGDIVGIYPDDHTFTDTEKNQFNIIDISESDVKKIKKDIADYCVTAKAVEATVPGSPSYGKSNAIRHYVENGKMKWRIIQ